MRIAITGRRTDNEHDLSIVLTVKDDGTGRLVVGKNECELEEVVINIGAGMEDK